jgi:hypothetical protein
MPFHIRKFKTGWKVYDDKGKPYSKKPLSKKTATAQLRALYANEADVFRGSGYAILGKNVVLDGDGFFSDVFGKIKSAVEGVVSRVRGVTKGIRTNYPPSVRAIINKYRDFDVVKLFIRRKPIVSLIDKALNFLSLGKWRQVKDKLNYDKLFHLSLIAAIRAPPAGGAPRGNIKYILVEKNEVINIKEVDTKEVTAQPRISVPINKPLKFGEMLDKAQALAGDDFFKYNAFSNNCQMFINGILNANQLNTQQLNEFVMQDVDTILKELPSYMNPFAKALTDIAGLANVALEGEGTNKTEAKRYKMRGGVVLVGRMMRGGMDELEREEALDNDVADIMEMFEDDYVDSVFETIASRYNLARLNEIRNHIDIFDEVPIREDGYIQEYARLTDIINRAIAIRLEEIEPSPVNIKRPAKERPLPKRPMRGGVATIPQLETIMNQLMEIEGELMPEPNETREEFLRRQMEMALQVMNEAFGEGVELDEIVRFANAPANQYGPEIINFVDDVATIILEAEEAREREEGEETQTEGDAEEIPPPPKRRKMDGGSVVALYNKMFGRGRKLRGGMDEDPTTPQRENTKKKEYTLLQIWTEVEEVIEKLNREYGYDSESEGSMFDDINTDDIVDEIIDELSRLGISRKDIARSALKYGREEGYTMFDDLIEEEDVEDDEEDETDDPEIERRPSSPSSPRDEDPTGGRRVRRVRPRESKLARRIRGVRERIEELGELISQGQDFVNNLNQQEAQLRTFAERRRLRERINATYRRVIELTREEEELRNLLPQLEQFQQLEQYEDDDEDGEDDDYLDIFDIRYHPTTVPDEPPTGTTEDEPPTGGRKVMRGGSLKSNILRFMGYFGLPSIAGALTDTFLDNNTLSMLAALVTASLSALIDLATSRARSGEITEERAEDIIALLREIQEDLDENQHNMTEGQYLERMNELMSLFNRANLGEFVELPAWITTPATSRIPTRPATDETVIEMTENPMRLNRPDGSGKKKAYGKGNANVVVDEKRLAELNKAIPSRKKWEASFKRRGATPTKSYEEFRANAEANNKKRATRDLAQEAESQKIGAESQQRLEEYKRQIRENPELEEIACKITKEGEPVKGSPLSNKMTVAECNEAKALYDRKLKAERCRQEPITCGLTKFANFAADNLADVVGVPKVATAAYKMFGPSDYYGLGSTKFAKQLKKLNLSPKEYLKKARAAANKAGYDGRALEFANDGEHKLMIYDDKGNAVKFGKAGMMDFILWTHSNPSVAKARRENYLKRSGAIKGDWKKNKFSANNLARNIIW